MSDLIYVIWRSEFKLDRVEVAEEYSIQFKMLDVALTWK